MTDKESALEDVRQTLLLLEAFVGKGVKPTLHDAEMIKRRLTHAEGKLKNQSYDHEAEVERAYYRGVEVGVEQGKLAPYPSKV